MTKTRYAVKWTTLDGETGKINSVDGNGIDPMDKFSAEQLMRKMRIEDNTVQSGTTYEVVRIPGTCDDCGRFTDRDGRCPLQYQDDDPDEWLHE